MAAEHHPIPHLALYRFRLTADLVVQVQQSARLPTGVHDLGDALKEVRSWARRSGPGNSDVIWLDRARIEGVTVEGGKAAPFELRTL